jgi:transcription termination/antitermination protein NusG
MNSLPADAWFVVQVAPRSEKRVVTVLEYKGYQLFAPTYLSRKRWSDRIKTLEEPLFPGYVFVRTAGAAVSGLVCSSPGVTRILSLGGRPTPVPALEIEAIRRLTLQGTPMPTPYIGVGQRVRICEGPLTGTVGIVRQIRNRTSLVVSVELISQSIYIVVDGLQLEPIASEVQDEKCS